MKEQKEELKRTMDVRVPKEVILSYFYPETSVVRMMEIRIIPTCSCALVYVHVTIYSIQPGGNAVETLDESGNKIVVLWEKTSRMNMPVQSIQGKQKVQGQRQKPMQRRVSVRWWGLPRIKDSGRTRKRNIPVINCMGKERCLV